MTLQFSDVYRGTTHNEINLLEKQIGYPLPAQYRNFLLEHNGGQPSLNTIHYQKPDEIKSSSTVVHYFFGIYEEFDTYDLYTNSGHYYLGSYEGRMPPNFLPIALDVFGNLFCLALTGTDIGKIYFWHHESSDFENRGLGIPPGYTDIDVVSNSFEEFLDSLYDD